MYNVIMYIITERMRLRAHNVVVDKLYNTYIQMYLVSTYNFYSIRVPRFTIKYLDLATLSDC